MANTSFSNTLYSAFQKNIRKNDYLSGVFRIILLLGIQCSTQSRDQKGLAENEYSLLQEILRLKHHAENKGCDKNDFSELASYFYGIMLTTLGIIHNVAALLWLRSKQLQAQMKCPTIFHIYLFLNLCNNEHHFTITVRA